MLNTGGLCMTLGLKSNIVELVDHNSEWEKIAQKTIQQLWKIIGSIAKDIQHIGSTSIKNIKAKPIIDIAVAVNDFKEFEPLIPELENNGFAYRGWFLIDRITVLNVYEKLQSGDKITTHHIHIVKVDSRDWNDHIKFRDYLNTHLTVAKNYEAIKIKLATENPIDEERKKYNDGKNGFISQTLKDATVWLRSK